MSAEPPAFPKAIVDDDDDVAWALQTAAVQWERGGYADAVVWLRRAAQAAVESGEFGRAADLERGAREVEGWVERGVVGPQPDEDDGVDSLLAGDAPEIESFALAEPTESMVDAMELESRDAGIDIAIDDGVDDLGDVEDVEDIEPVEVEDLVDDPVEELLDTSPRAVSGPPNVPALIDVPRASETAEDTSDPATLPPSPSPVATGAATAFKLPPPPIPRVAPAAKRSLPVPQPRSSGPPSAKERAPRSSRSLEAPRSSRSPEAPRSSRSLEAPRSSRSTDSSRARPSTAYRSTRPSKTPSATPSDVAPTEAPDGPASLLVPSAPPSFVVPAGPPSDLVPTRVPAPIEEAPEPSAEFDLHEASTTMAAASEVEVPDAPVSAPPAVPKSPPPFDVELLAACRGLEDLPPETQVELAHRARVEELAPEQEVSGFGLALVTRGSVAVMPTIAEAACGHAQRGEPVFARGNLAEGVSLRVVAEAEGADVAVWQSEDFEKLLETCPWVADELRVVADRYQALAGSAMGPLGERLDDAMRAMVTDRCEVRFLQAGDVLVEQGKPVAGLNVIGAGKVELVVDGAVRQELLPGDLPFAADVLSHAPASGTLRAAPTGALVLQADRMTTHELLVSVPPLLELLATS